MQTTQTTKWRKVRRFIRKNRAGMFVVVAVLVMALVFGLMIAHSV